MMNPLNPMRLFTRIVLASIIILPIIVHFERNIMQWFIPLWQWEIMHLDESFNILFFGITDTQGASNLELNVIFNHEIVINSESQAITSNFFGSAGLLTQNVLHPMMIISIAILAWPAEKWLSYGIRIGVGLALVVLVMMMDSPFQLLASILNTFSKQIDSPWVTPTSMIYWSDFLNGGGLFALSLVSSFIAIRAGLVCETDANHSPTAD
jgi:hypothetical protein